MKDLFITREYKKSQEIDDDFFGDNNFANEKNSKLGNKFLGKFLSEKKINILGIFIVVCFLLLLGKAFYLQILKGQYYQSLAENNRTRENALPAARGLIYDKNFKPLVKNYPVFNSAVLPKDLSLNSEKRAGQIKIIAQTLGLDEKQINGELDKYPKNFKYQVVVKENIEYEQAVSLMIVAGQIPGLYIATNNQRRYFYPIEFSHILGYQGKISDQELQQKSQAGYLLNDYIGKAGLELSYEDILRGQFGKEGLEVDAAGREQKVLYHQEPTNGKSVQLSIDLNVQKKVRDIFVSSLKRFNKQRGAVVMLNPETDEILALVSYPDFDNNLFALGISNDDYKKLTADENKPLFDRAVKGEYPSGSSIKPVIAAGALQDGIVSDKTTVLSTGGIWVYDRWFFPDWSATGHGLTNVYKAIAWSVNTYFYYVGGGYQDFKGLGVEGLDKYFKLFGLGEKTGIDLPGEAAGLVPTPEWKKQTKNEDWYIGDTYHMAIGQGDVLVTPLQVANYTAALANGGTLRRPYLVKEILDNNGNKEVIQPEVIRENFIDPKNIEIVRKAMRQTVTLGSAQYLNNLPVAVAGKTGTAQWSDTKGTHAWFTGFAPYDKPEVAITVLVEEGGEGSTVSVPITYDILDWYFNVYKKSH